MKSYKTLTHEELVRALSYNQDTGIFTWNITAGKARAGDVADSIGSSGYIAIGLARARMMAHRLAWFYVTGAWPHEQIDHINGNRTDNRFCNLRAVAQWQNNLNLSIQYRSRSGHKGVRFVSNRWRAEVVYRRRKYYLGRFSDKNEAILAYEQKSKELFGEFKRQEAA